MEDEIPSFTTIEKRVQDATSKCVANVLRDQDYQASSVQEWTEGICSATVTALRKISGLFKYTATCVLTEKTGAGLHTSSAACWEPASDGCVVERWENQSILAIVVVFVFSV